MKMTFSEISDRREMGVKDLYCGACGDGDPDLEPGGDLGFGPEEVFMFLICLKAGGEMTVGTVGCRNEANPFLSLTEEDLRGIFSLGKFGEIFTAAAASWPVTGLTSCLAGGLITGMRTSVKVLLSRLCRESEGRRAWLGVGVVGVQKLVLVPPNTLPGVG